MATVQHELPSAETHPAPVGAHHDRSTLGVHIANRLVEVGCHHAFAVPGDFNLL